MRMWERRTVETFVKCLQASLSPPPSLSLPYNSHMQRRLFVNIQISRAFQVDLHFVLSERRFIIIFLFDYSFFFSCSSLLLFPVVFCCWGGKKFAFWATEVDKFFDPKSESRRTCVLFSFLLWLQMKIYVVEGRWRGELRGIFFKVALKLLH